jgi:hypothetical protein
MLADFATDLVEQYRHNGLVLVGNSWRGNESYHRDFEVITVLLTTSY